jgi:hypothetical protein
MIVTIAGRDAVDAAAFRARGDRRAGVITRERPVARRRETLQRTAKSCGPDASTPASSLAAACGPDRVPARQLRKATVTNKPDHRGEHDISR